MQALHGCLQNFPPNPACTIHFSKAASLRSSTLLLDINLLILPTDTLATIMTSQARATELTRLNIHGIFDEREASKRFKTMSEIWVASGEALFVDPLGVFKTYEAISAVVEKIQGFGGPKDEFVELSECLQPRVTGATNVCCR
jgi:hypothetical protein